MIIRMLSHHVQSQCISVWLGPGRGSDHSSVAERSAKTFWSLAKAQRRGGAALPWLNSVWTTWQFYYNDQEKLLIGWDGAIIFFCLQMTEGEEHLEPLLEVFYEQCFCYYSFSIQNFCSFIQWRKIPPKVVSTSTACITPEDFQTSKFKLKDSR